MTLLSHDHGRSCYPARQARADNRAEPPIGASRESAMRGFFRFVVTIVLSTVALAGIIALKTEIYLPHFNQ